MRIILKVTVTCSNPPRSPLLKKFREVRTCHFGKYYNTSFETDNNLDLFYNAVSALGKIIFQIIIIMISIKI